MSLYFDRALPIWLIVILFVALSVMTVRLYRRHELRRPYRWWLPSLRIAAVFLLLSTLLQPVLVRVWHITERGKIAVLIDNSGSMSIRDDYSLAEQVETAWQLGLFPADARCRVFADGKEQLLAGESALAAAVKAGENWLAAARTDEATARESGEILRRQTEAARTVVEQLHRTILNAAGEVDYLARQGQRSPPPEPPEESMAQAPAPTGGGLILKRWRNLPGWEVKSLTDSPRFRDAADDAELLVQFAAPRNAGDNYGAVLQGYLNAPDTGDYVFLLSTDDQGQLFLSPTHHRAERQLIAECPSFCEYGSFSKFGEQTSKPIRLEAGRSYYIEAIFKEAAGEDHCVVGWRRPDGKEEIPIPGAMLSPYGRIPRPRIGPPFVTVLEQYRQAMDALLTEIRTAEAQTALIAGLPADQDSQEKLRQLVRRLRDLTVRLASVRHLVEQLQPAADVELAVAAIPDVDSALDRFGTMNRAEIVRHLLVHKPIRLWRGLEERGEVELFSLDGLVRGISPSELTDLTEDLPQTNLGTRLHEILRHYEDQQVTALVVLSDGNNNAGKALREVKEIASDRDIPIYAVGIGAERPPRDVAIDHVVAPATAFRNDTVAVSVTLKRQGFTDRPITLKIVSDGKTLNEKSVPPGPENRITVDMSFPERRSGVLNYRAEAGSFEGEQLTQNNRKTFRVNVLKDPIKTLLIDEFPRWESRYCNIMLKRDPRIALDTIFVASLPNGMLTTGTSGWPESRDALFAYQILIMGDVNPRHFSPEQLSQIRDFVVDRGGTVVFMAGPHYLPEQYLATPLADLFPVRTSRRRPEAGATVAASHPLQVAEESLYDSLIQIGNTPDQSARLWEGLPSLDWVKNGVTASRAADRLVETGEDQEPVMLKANVGLGKVLYLGSDSFWRWREQARWTYHHRLWGQILLWATLGRSTGSDKYVKLMTSRPEYTPGETVEIRARLLDDNELPIKNAQATAEIFSRETGSIIKIVNLEYLPDSGGKYVGYVRDVQRGKYRIIPLVDQLKDKKISAEAFFEVRDLPTSEYVDLALNAPSLTSFTVAYRPYNLAGELPNLIPKRDQDRQRREEREIWDTFWVMLLAAVCLGLEWFFRKRNQLI